MKCSESDQHIYLHQKLRVANADGVQTKQILSANYGAKKNAHDFDCDCMRSDRITREVYAEIGYGEVTRRKWVQFATLSSFKLQEYNIT